MRRLGLLGLFIILGAAVPVRAQIYPPRPGVPLPSGYFQRMEADRTAFRFKRAWKAQAERVREQRRQWERDNLAAGPAPAVTGVKRVPVLVGLYSNMPNPPYTLEDLQERLFDGPNPNGTVTDFYDEISSGNVTLTGDVMGSGTAPYRLSHADTYYEGPDGCNGLCDQANTGQFLKEMLDALDPNVDFGLYDNDGPDGLPNSGDDDGFVDFVAFVHPESGGECGGNNMWSHRWVYEGWWGTSYETGDDAARGGKIRVSDYTIQPLLSCDDESLIEIGVYAHEFGHAFGLPDLYDTNPGDGDSMGIGNWGLMASGSWGGDGHHPARPAHMCAWSKEQLGWVNPVTLCTASSLDLGPVESTGDVVRIYPHGEVDTEYFLLEYRSKEGFDSTLPTSGLAVWHIDNDNPGNGDEARKLVDLEEADGRRDLDQSTNRGDSGDLYPGGTANHTFDMQSNPNSRANNTVPTGIALTDINYGGAGITLSAELTECRLRLQGLAVNDDTWGDGAGNLGKDELVQLNVCLANDFDYPRDDVAVHVSTESDKVTLLNDQADVGRVALDDTRCASFWLQSGDGVEDGEAIEFTVTVTGSGGYESVNSTSLFAGDYVLIVEDNGIFGYVNDYVAAVTAAGYEPVVYNTEELPTPTVGTLQGALATVWFTGPDSYTTLKRDEQETVKGYLLAGETLFLSGDDIGYDLVQDGSGSDRLFYETWLKARYVTDVSPVLTLEGVPGDPVTDGVAYSLNKVKSKWPSVIEPLGGSHAVLNYTGDHGVGAVHYEGDYNLLYTAFNFEAGQPGQRDLIMTRFLNRHIPSDRTAPTLELTGEPQGTVDACQPVTVTWSAEDNTEVSRVEVFLVRMGDPLRSLAELDGNPGTYTWDPDVPGEVAFRVVARDPTGLQNVQETGTFIVSDTDPPQVAVTFPNGGESLEPGAAVDVTWTQSDCLPIVRATVSVSDDDGSTWEVLGEAAGESRLTWQLPENPANQLLIRVEVEDAAGNISTDESDAPFTSGVDDVFAGATRAVLLQNQPNPFETETNWLYYVPQRTPVTFSVYDVNGRLIRRVFEGVVDEGQYEVAWDGLTDDGVEAPGGMYFMVLRSQVGNQTRKMVRL